MAGFAKTQSELMRKHNGRYLLGLVRIDQSAGCVFRLKETGTKTETKGPKGLNSLKRNVISGLYRM